MNGGHDDDETLTAYHEAGHAVIAFALGGDVRSIQLGGEADDFLPERFGDCRIAWGPVDPQSDWQRQREMMSVLAGPVAEMIYTGDPFHPAWYGPWQHDWQIAWGLAEGMSGDAAGRTRLLEKVTVELHRRMQSDPIWPAIAAVADELTAHEFLDHDQIADTVGFWFRAA